MSSNSGKVLDESWFQEVTESVEDTVREFLEMPKEQSKETIQKVKCGSMIRLVRMTQ